MSSSSTTALNRSHGPAMRLLLVLGGFAFAGCFGGPTSDFPFEDKSGDNQDEAETPTEGAGGGGNGSRPDAGEQPGSPTSSDGDADGGPQTDDPGNEGTPTPNDGGMPDPCAQPNGDDAGALPPCDGGSPNVVDQNVTVSPSACDSGKRLRATLRLEQQLGDQPADSCARRETHENNAE